MTVSVSTDEVAAVVEEEEEDDAECVGTGR